MSNICALCEGGQSPSRQGGRKAERRGEGDGEEGVMLEEKGEGEGDGKEGVMLEEREKKGIAKKG